MSSPFEDVQRLLGRIEGKVDMLVDQGRIQDDRHNALEGRVREIEGGGELEARVRRVEGRQHWYAGAAAALSASATYFLKGWH